MSRKGDDLMLRERPESPYHPGQKPQYSFLEGFFRSLWFLVRFATVVLAMGVTTMAFVDDALFEQSVNRLRTVRDRVTRTETGGRNTLSEVAGIFFVGNTDQAHTVASYISDRSVLVTEDGQVLVKHPVGTVGNAWSLRPEPCRQPRTSPNLTCAGNAIGRYNWPHLLSAADEEDTAAERRETRWNSDKLPSIQVQRGDRSPAVRDLQIFLNENGNPIAPSGPGSSGNETMRFGPATERALKQFQSRHNLAPTGRFDRQTLRFLRDNQP